MKKLLVLGNGGHCKSVLDCLREPAVYNKIGIVSRDMPVGSSFSGFPVVGTDDELEFLLHSGYEYAFIAVGSLGDVTIRKILMRRLISLGFQLPCIVDTTAAIAQDVVLGCGIFIGKNTVVNAQTVLGDCSIINSGAIVEHDCKIDAFAHISPGTVLCGNVVVGENTHVGANSTVLQGLAIGNDVVIGGGSVVTKNISAFTKAIGNPCRPKESLYRDDNTGIGEPKT